MARLSSDLRDLGYEPTERESPFDEEGTLWTNSYELVCDRTGFVIRKDNSDSYDPGDDDEERYTYRNTGRVKQIGGFVSSYDWGDDGDGFSYTKRASDE